MKEEKRYRIPEAKEFVQGFEFEVAKDCKMIILDLSKPNKKDDTPFTRFWSKSKVWWECKPDEFITQDYHGHKVTLRGSTMNFFKPFDVQSFIDQGLIRVEI